eukprot:2878999-Rhodomonas_salina.1
MLSAWAVACPTRYNFPVPVPTCPCSTVYRLLWPASPSHRKPDCRPHQRQLLNRTTKLLLNEQNMTHLSGSQNEGGMAERIRKVTGASDVSATTSSWIRGVSFWTMVASTTFVRLERKLEIFCRMFSRDKIRPKQPTHTPPVAILRCSRLPVMSSPMRDKHVTISSSAIFSSLSILQRCLHLKPATVLY